MKFIISLNLLLIVSGSFAMENAKQPAAAKINTAIQKIYPYHKNCIFECYHGTKFQKQCVKPHLFNVLSGGKRQSLLTKKRKDTTKATA